MEQRYATVVGAEAATPNPHQLAAGAQLVQQPRLVAAHARREHVALIDRPRQERAFELHEHLQQPIQAAGFGADAVPRRQEAPERGGRDWFDFAPQARQRASAQRAQHVWIAPFALRAAGSELASEQAAGLLEPPQ